MTLLIHLLLLCVGVHLLGIFFPIQWVWIGLLVYGLLYDHKRFTAFLLGFLSVFIVWTIYAFVIDLYNQHILSERIGNLLGGMPYYLLPLITGLIGGIGGGLSVWAGNNIKKMIWQK